MDTHCPWSSHPNMNSSINNTDPITHSVMLSGQYEVAVDIVGAVVPRGTLNEALAVLRAFAYGPGRAGK